MNEVLAPRYAEVIHRLAVGIEPYDIARAARVPGGLSLEVERPVRLRGVPLRHASGRWSIRYARALPTELDVLIDDPGRRYVPRRLRFPVLAEADVRAAEAAGGHAGAALRTWRPALYPGAAYVAAGATGLRGRALIAGAPARWVRAEAVVRGTSRIVGRAHGDDRGEFLLIVGPDPAAAAELPDVLALTVGVRAREPVHAAPGGDGVDDPVWDLPLESLVPPGPTGPVADGVELPAGYAPGFTATRDVDLVPGRIRVDVAPFDLA